MRSALLLSVITVLFSWLISSSPALAQDPAATNSTAASRAEQLAKEKELIDKETELLEARQKYLDALKKATGESTITPATSGGKTDHATSTSGIFETTAMSFTAAKELARDIDKTLTEPVSGYNGIVFYNDADFSSLSRYRLYREQAGRMLRDYDDLVKEISTVKIDDRGDKTFTADSVDRSFAGSTLLTGLNLPGIAIGAIKSVAELLSLFRTDRTITDYPGGVDNRALNTVLAGTLLRKHNNLRIFDPVQYVPEYDNGIGEPDSFYTELARVRTANILVSAFLDGTSKLPAKQRQSPPLSNVIGHAILVKAQLDGLVFPVLPDPVPNNPSAAATLSEFRSLVRAEKLDRFIRRYAPGKVGILRSRVISSGGSVRHSKNLLLGNKTDYSGSAIVEILLYDLDGGMRASEIFTYHTGFRKIRNGLPVTP